jgi:hypothetical protein
MNVRVYAGQRRRRAQLRAGVWWAPRDGQGVPVATLRRLRGRLSPVTPGSLCQLAVGGKNRSFGLVDPNSRRSLRNVRSDYVKEMAVDIDDDEDDEEDDEG